MGLMGMSFNSLMMHSGSSEYHSQMGVGMLITMILAISVISGLLFGMFAVVYNKLIA